MESQNRILRTPAAAEYVGLSISTLEKFRITGEGPQFVRIGVRAVGYQISDLQDWIRARVRSSTSEGKKPLPAGLENRGEA
jgi:predicted DNA-binding transcriptional regulator AlpA